MQLYIQRDIFNETRNNEVTASNNSEVAMFSPSAYGSTIPFSNESVSNDNKLSGSTIIRREKEDTPKVYQVPENFIVNDKNKTFFTV